MHTTQQVRTMGPSSRKIITNPDMIALNQVGMRLPASLSDTPCIHSPQLHRDGPLYTTDTLALNQDKLGHRGAIAYQSDHYYRTLTTFVKKLSEPSSPRAAAMFNRGETAASYPLTRTQMGFASGSCACVSLTDLDTHQVVARCLQAPLPVRYTLCWRILPVR